MALVSPGLEITIINESQYVPAAVGSVPLVVLATKQDKQVSGGVADGTTQDMAGKLQIFTSQRELITSLGYPEFELSAAGTPINGSQLNEYGLLAAYSTLAACNRLYAIRADIDLAQLENTAVRPIGEPDDGTYWLDLSESAWGINEWDAGTQSFAVKTPLTITSSDNAPTVGGIPTPLDSLGQIGAYAVTVLDVNNYVWYKGQHPDLGAVWSRVGTTQWQESIPTVVGPTVTAVSPASISINGTTISVTGTTITAVATAINNAAITGVTASVLSSGKLAIYVTSASQSDGLVTDGKMEIAEVGVGTILATLGIDEDTYLCPTLHFGSYVSVPAWRTTDTDPAPSGSIWAKTSALGNGLKLSLKKFNADTGLFASVATNVYETEAESLYGMDPGGGGFSIKAGALFVKYNNLETDTMNFRIFYRRGVGETRITGTAPTSPMVFNNGDEFDVTYTVAGSSAPVTKTVTIGGTSASAFVASFLAAEIPRLSAQIESTGAITFIHEDGGSIVLANATGTPLTTAGFTSSTTNVRVNHNGVGLLLSNWSPLNTYTVSAVTPYNDPSNGTLWFWGSVADNDIMINSGTGWAGYKTLTSDARGYNLQATDPAGPIVSASAPPRIGGQSDGTDLEPGDLWINTSSTELDTFPMISRWNGSKWVAIDNSDRITSNGIVFADARWSADGEVDPITGAFPEISELLSSNYIDLDAPDYRLYPRGTLLYNTRRSSNNVKQWIGDKFTEKNYPDDDLTGLQEGTWQTVSGLRGDGSPYSGASAQRNMVVKAMRAAVDSNTVIREDNYQFNLIAAPGYWEIIPNLVALNNDRKQTAFVVGDTPMDLRSNIVDITTWANNTDGFGLSSASEYLGVFYPSGQTSEPLNGNTVVVPSSHMMLRTIIHNDNVSFPWFAPAGARRGVIDNVDQIGYINKDSGAFVRNGVNQGLRDGLYSLQVNPITQLPGLGIVAYGQKTRAAYGGAMDRINVARLVNYIRTILSSVGNSFLFEPNDKTTRDQIKRVIEGALNDLVAKRGLYDYLVVCDETNNTPTRIARNELYVDIAIEPTKTVEFIYIPIRLKNPGDISALG